jgi:hypothetical protein
MYQVLVPVDRNVERAFYQAKYVERLADGRDVEATAALWRRFSGLRTTATPTRSSWPGASGPAVDTG